MKIVALLLFFIPTFVSGYTYCIQPDHLNPSGNLSQCLLSSINVTLNDIASQDNGRVSIQDSILYFLPGIHQLNISVIFHHSVNLRFKGLGEMNEGPHETVMESPVVINCDHAAVTFSICSDVSFVNITFKSCGQTFPEYFKPALQFIDTSNVLLKYLSFQNNAEVALYYWPSPYKSVNLTILHSSFYRNGYGIVLQHQGPTPSYDVNVSYSNMTHNNIGLFITYQESATPATIQMESLVVANNKNTNIEVYTYSNHYAMKLINLVSCGSPLGLFLNHSVASTDKNCSFIEITNTSFYNHSQTGIMFVVSGYGVGTFSLSSSCFRGNKGLFGTSLKVLIAEEKPMTGKSFSVHMDNVTLDGNSINQLFVDSNHYSEVYATTVGIANCRNLSINNCNFSNNEGSGLSLFDSRVFFSGVNNFINNTAYRGAGLVMAANSYSYLFLKTGVSINFINNTAIHKGGAIFVEQNIVQLGFGILSIISCFYQYHEPGKIFHFEGNKAGVAGSVLYGGATEKCLIEETTKNNSFLDISTFFNQSDHSLISSDPHRVCFCLNDSKFPDCSQDTLSKSAIPGENIDFTIAVVGQHNNVTTGIVNISSNTGAHSNQNISIAQCISLKYVIKVKESSAKNMNVRITVSNPAANAIITPIIISVDIKQCLPGTTLSQQSHVCECDQSVINCNGINATVMKNEPSWIAVYNKSNCTRIIVYPFCPYDYCKQSSVTFSLSDPDKQCAFNRSGLLCGACDQNLSLMLGSNKCGECTNDYLALIIPFALAGIILVILLIALNLTVTVGAINGLLFFSNVVKIYQPLLFGIDNVPVLSQFISWINLDLGIETCFANGLNSFYKSLLQFAFPFYLWFLIILIIKLSQSFSKLSRVIGNNAVPVLCTLLLLSYTKLLCTVISILKYATPFRYATPFKNVTSSSGCIGAVWYDDATEPYFSGRHLALFIIALVALIGLFLPYILLLLFFPLWELCRSKRYVGTSLYLRLKPFFDAYAGPHTDRFCIWPGLLLVARSVIAATIAVSTDNTVTLSMSVAVIIVLLVTMNISSVYKSNWLHILDVCYLFCLQIIFYILFGALSASDSEVSLNDAKKGMTVMLSLSFIGFLCIIGYHIYSLSFIKKCMKKKRSVPLDDVVAASSDESFSSNATPTKSVLDVLLREPLLEND